MWGAILGATALTAIPELLRAGAEYRLLVYGALLVLMMRARPQGLLGESGQTGSHPFKGSKVLARFNLSSQ